MSDVPNQQTEKQAADENSHNLKPWLDRWENRRIGFHLQDVNPVLTKFAKDLLQLSDDETSAATECSPSRVFVPLCGKTVDLAFLAKMSAEVYGVEGIQTALEEFAQEHPDSKIVNQGSVDGFVRFQGDKITLLKGDYFQLTDTHTKGKFEAIYDRASMVAIDPALRKDYVQVISGLIKKGGVLLLVVLERVGPEEFTSKGPPFSIPPAAVHELYGGLEWVESVTQVYQEDQLKDNPSEQERYAGLDQLLETAYIIRAKK